MDRGDQIVTEPSKTQGLPAVPGTVFELVADLRQRDPAALALMDGEIRPLTASELEQQVIAIGAELARNGLGPGDRVALVMPSDASGAAWLIGATAYVAAVPLNPDLTAGDFELLFGRLGVRGLVFGKAMNAAAREVAAAMDLAVIDVEQDNWRLGEPSAAGPKPNGPQDIALILLTSGTTAESKVVANTSTSFLAKVAQYASAFDLGPADRCLNIMPLYHGHGFFGGVMAPLMRGGSSICLGAFDRNSFFPALTDLGPTWYTASFTVHYAVLAAVARDPASIAGHRLRLVNTGSGVLAPENLAELEASFGIPIVVSYGLTEAGLVSVTSITAEDRRPGSVGRPVTHPVAIVDAEGRHLPPGTEGEVAVKGPQVTPRYEGDAASTAAASLPDGWFRTGDSGSLDADGVLSLTGRIKEMINRGGEKITPAEVDAALAGHPDVAEAAAFGFAHPTLGEEVAAAVVLRPDASVTPDALKAFARRSLAPFKVPKSIVVTDKVPHGPTGKLQRFKLAETFAPDLGVDRVQPEPGTNDREPTAVEAILARIWAEELGRTAVGLDDDFFVLGGDSLQAERVFLQIENELGRRPSIAALYSASTVRALARFLDEDHDFSYLVAIRSDGNRRPFFCVHGGGGNVIVFRDLARHIDAARPFYGLQAGGVDGAEISLFHVEDMAAAYIDAIRTVQPTGPYLLGGYSSGGLIAHSMAVQLREQGEKVAALALLDTYSSAIDETASPAQAWRRNRDRIRDMRLSEAVPFLRNRVVSLHRYCRSRIRSAIYRVRFHGEKALSGPPPRGRESLVASFRIARQLYRPKPFDGRATLFRASEAGAKLDHRYADWPKLVTGGIEIRSVPGNHHSIIHGSNVRSLGSAVDTYLASADVDV